MTDANSTAAQFGVLGLGVMGSSLAQNVADKGFSVAVWNREPELTEALQKKPGGQRFRATTTLEEFVAALERPRRILLMIQAGAPVDETVGRLLPLLAADDIVIDGGNSWFADTQRREKECAARGVHFVGMGVSGGEEGARHGPSLMPGGTPKAYERLKPVLEAIAARSEAGACVTHVGPDGAGHFVKMVHNGIEYGDMQLIAEVYDVLHRAAGLSPSALAEVFAKWNEGPLASFLIEITAKILRVREQGSGTPLVNLVLDQAGQKGTGRWTASLALELGVAVPTIAAAVDARVLSGLRAERAFAGEKLKGPLVKVNPKLTERMIALGHDALWLGRIVAYAQGMALIQKGSEQHRWKIQLGEIARIWKGGCIIRSKLLDTIRVAFTSRKPPANLLISRDGIKLTRKTHKPLRRFVAAAQAAGVPVPALSSALAYYDTYRAPELPTNLVQAQRDAFGAHTYLRKDKPEGGPVHTDWLR